MSAQSLRLLYLNAGHFVDHLFMLIFAKAAVSAGLAFGLAADGAYAEMIPYGIPSLMLFGACAPLAAHLADKWTRNAMIAVFFTGIGAAAIATSFATTPLQIAVGLAGIGIFAAIYHPVGIAMVVEGGGRVGWRLGINGVWGNMGVAAAPLITGLILSSYDWRMAFIVPGVMSVAIGIGFAMFVRSGRAVAPEATKREKALVGFAPGWKRALLAIALVTSAGGFVFGSMTFIIPRMFEVRMPDVTTDIALTGMLAASIYAVAAFAQLGIGRMIDTRPIKLILLCVALGQPVLIGLMAMQTDYALYAAALLAMAFVFSQIPIADTVLARYVPDEWRAKVLSIKFLLNLGVGALSLLAARAILSAGGGFQMVMVVIAIAGCFIVLAALILPSKSGVELEPKSEAAPAE